MSNRPNISPEQEQAAYALFKELLPYYWSRAHEVPARLRLAIALNRYPNAALACVGIANHELVTPKLKRDACACLNDVQAWKGEIV